MTRVSEPTKALLVLSMLKGVGPATLRRLVNERDFNRSSILERVHETPAFAKALEAPDSLMRAQEAMEKQVEEACRFDAHILSPLDAEYPKLLSATKDDPFLISVRGRLAPTPEKSVAVIGTREPTAHGVLIAERVVRFLTERKWSIVSGLAYGCDAIAHQAALDSNGHTVAVLAHGLHTVSPARNRALAEKIVESGGALVSEYRFGQGARPEQFVKRDRTQAGMAQGVVMIQSDVQGGSLHASRAALDYKRWLAIPYPTSLDRTNKEPKVQANLLLAEGSPEEKTRLLRCSPEDLTRLIILQGKDDYPQLLEPKQSPEPKTEGIQSTLTY